MQWPRTLEGKYYFIMFSVLWLRHSVTILPIFTVLFSTQCVISYILSCDCKQQSHEAGQEEAGWQQLVPWESSQDYFLMEPTGVQLFLVQYFFLTPSLPELQQLSFKNSTIYINIYQKLNASLSSENASLVICDPF